MTKPVLLAVSGSLRRDSYRTAILTALVEAVSDPVEVRLPPLRDVPFYDQDPDAQTPPSGVAALRQAIGHAHGRHARI